MRFNNSTAIAPEVPVHNCPLHCTSTAQTNKESITITHDGVHPSHLDVLITFLFVAKIIIVHLGPYSLEKALIFALLSPGEPASFIQRPYL